MASGRCWERQRSLDFWAVAQLLLDSLQSVEFFFEHLLSQVWKIFVVLEMWSFTHKYCFFFIKWSFWLHYHLCFVVIGGHHILLDILGLSLILESYLLHVLALMWKKISLNIQLFSAPTWWGSNISRPSFGSRYSDVWYIWKFNVLYFPLFTLSYIWFFVVFIIVSKPVQTRSWEQSLRR